ncbi:MAG: hypothetical protein H6Q59_3044 [Firmicutes bacterium]|nr:hypothetical protein [Bacillota bacterium]
MIAQKKKRDFVETFKLSEGGIVGVWDLITKALSVISVLEVIILIYKKIIGYQWEDYKPLIDELKAEMKKHPNSTEKEILSKKKEHYKLYSRMSALYKFINLWVSCHVFLAAGMSLILFYLITSDNHFAIYSISIYGIWRVFEIIIKQVRIILFDTIGKHRIYIKSPRRSIILLIHNIVEMIFWFACIFMSACFLDSSIITDGSMHLSDLFRWSDFIRCSTLQFTIFGDSYTPLSGLLTNQSTLVNIAFWEILAGLIIILISLARFVSLLPQVSDQILEE